MDDDVRLQRLRKERNIAGIATVLFILISMAICAPQNLRRRAELKAARDDVVLLQLLITNSDQKTRDVQAEIIRAQKEIQRALHPNS